MHYRRNADTRLRKMEREWSSTGNLDLLIPINRERRRVGWPAHPDARVIFANNALFKLVHRFAQQLTSMLQVYDEYDPAMYIHELRMLRGADEYEEPDEEDEQATIIPLIKGVLDEIRQLERERNYVLLATTDLQMSGEVSENYINLINRHGIGPIALGEIPELPEEKKEALPDGSFTIPFYSRQQLALRATSGFQETMDQIGWMLQLVSRRALRIYRKILTYGMLPMAQIIQQGPQLETSLINYWHESEIAELDDLADNIEIATNEVVDVAQGFGPSPEAIELFSRSWYKDED